MANPSLDLAVALRMLIESVVRQDSQLAVRQQESRVSAALAQWGNALAEVTAEEVMKKLRAHGVA